MNPKKKVLSKYFIIFLTNNLTRTFPLKQPCDSEIFYFRTSTPEVPMERKEVTRVGFFLICIV